MIAEEEIKSEIQFLKECLDFIPSGYEGTFYNRVGWTIGEVRKVWNSMNRPTVDEAIREMDRLAYSHLGPLIPCCSGN